MSEPQAPRSVPRNGPALFPPAAKPSPTALAAPQHISTAMAPAASATLEIGRGGEVVRVGFDTANGFEALQRVGRLFASSGLVPESYRGNIANCVIAIEMAARMGASPLMVMQNLYLVHGNPSWSSKFLIASFNGCGRFTAIRYRWVGERGKDTFGCVAHAREKSTGEDVVSPAVTWAMVKAEGWNAKKGSKWLSMPELMFCYRAAAFLIRLTAPELTMGLQMAEESEELIGEPIPATEEKRGISGMRDVLGLNEPTHDLAAFEPEPPHDPRTGEVRDSAPSSEEQAEIAAREREESEVSRG